MKKDQQRPRSAVTQLTAPTLEDVARHAGVSTATVSRCLNGPAQVAEATKKRVMDSIEHLNYAPNFGAQSLAAKRTNTFGAIVPTMENAIFARGLQAFQEELERHGITLLVASSSYSVDIEEQQIKTLIARGADALLLIGKNRRQQSYEFLDRRQVPFVLAWSYVPESQYICTGFDNERAMQMLAQKVIELGHRSIAVITAPQGGNDRAASRVQGVKAALAANGIDPHTVRVVETPYSISNGSVAFAQLMAEKTRPTAVMCGNDVLACGALKMAREMGIRVPEEVSVTGFDDIELAQIVTPSLTTVCVPHRAMGEAAAQKLISMRNGQDYGANLELEVSIAVRESLAPVPSF